MKSVLTYVIVVTIAVVPAIGCGEKVTKIDPVQAEQSNQTQKAMVQQERGM